MRRLGIVETAGAAKGEDRCALDSGDRGCPCVSRAESRYDRALFLWRQGITHPDRNAEVGDRSEGVTVQYGGAEEGHLRCLFVGQADQSVCVGDLQRRGCEHAADVGPDLDSGGAGRTGEHARREVGSTSAKGACLASGVAGNEPRHDWDDGRADGSEPIAHAVGGCCKIDDHLPARVSGADELGAVDGDRLEVQAPGGRRRRSARTAVRRQRAGVPAPRRWASPMSSMPEHRILISLILSTDLVLQGARFGRLCHPRQTVEVATPDP